MSLLSKVFGTKNQRELKKLVPFVQQINDLRASLEAKSDAQLRDQTAEFRQRLDNGAPLDELLPEAFATVREAAWRTLKMRHFDVQLMGGMVLHQGKIAEMRTGEGKTLTATLPLYLNALEGRGVHLVTVNDYLARRDAEWMGQIYGFLGLSTGVIVHGVEDWQRQRNYRCDITYGQNNEFGFDYLRDNMKMSPDRMVQRGQRYALVDEVDSILIDEARTPLIISGPSEASADLYTTVDRVVPRLKRDVDYTVDEKAHAAMLTDQGVERVEKLLGLKNLYDPANIAYNHHVAQALRAHTLYKRDVNYLIDDGKILIIDEFTGRKMPGRRWSDGLHQAIEAKEGVEIEEENQTLATITFQNFFRMYDKLAGMTGTADTEAAEFHHIYKLEVMVIPTNKSMIRDDMPDLVYKNEKGKFRAVFEDIADCSKRGQPVLVGTTSVEKSEVVASLLKKEGLSFEVLNAKQHEREAGIVAQAGRRGAITISTNMAGRGTDIILGGNAEYMAKEMMKAEGRASEPGQYERLIEQLKQQCDAEREQVLAAGGLKIIGTERHESRRIDNQLRGRAGRQGDPGGSRFYLSLEDDLLRIFGADRISGLMERLGMEEDVPIESGLVTRSIENAQKKVEGHNFDSRKNLLEYDDVMNQQRKTIYSLRRQILKGEYAPSLSEEQQKAGVKPEVPTQSGDWTIEKLSTEIRPELAAIVDAALEAERQKTEQPAESVDEGDEEGGNGAPQGKQPPAWRQLRSQLWRQTGAWCDIEKLFSPSARDALVDYVVAQVAASLVQQRERMFDLVDGLIGYLVDQFCPSNQQSDVWDFDALEEAVHDQFALEIELKRKAGDAQQVAEQIWKALEVRLAERMEELSRPWLMYFSRHFYLEEIDHQWIDHLKAMEHLREGIGLRGYGQKDPKKEYKKEGFELFAQMMQNIQVNTGRKLFRVQIQRQESEIPAMQAKQRRTVESHAAAATSGAETVGQSAAEPAASSAYGKASDGGATAAAKQKTVRRDQPKVGRNDPCPCGSGKKFKKCHGREEDETASA
ncbi:MAG TPA: preprotein translocase subunit SecA [Kofleriaceae bacterium]|nr:preprotein translocase subunit SecA [Kofleriaceae bacterium]